MYSSSSVRFLLGLKYIACLAIISFFLGGCAKIRGYMHIDANLPVEADIAVESLLAGANVSLNHSEPIIVSTLVNVDSLEESSTFGRMFSELLVASLVRRQFTVKEIKSSSSIFIKKNQGEFLLSRELSRVRKMYDASTMVVGTYAVAQYTVIVSVRLVDAESAVVMSSYDTVLPLGSDMRTLAF